MPEHTAHVWLVLPVGGTADVEPITAKITVTATAVGCIVAG